jgi:hypothetical protein
MYAWLIGQYILKSLELDGKEVSGLGLTLGRTTVQL